MTIQILRAGDRAATPWKNGGGVTREIAAFPPGAGLESFDWRISMATVAVGGPFSTFPGVDRRLAVLEGELVLRVEGRGPLRLGPRSAPAAFPGDVTAAADTPPTPVTDLNVMTRRGRIRSRVNRRRLDRPRTLITTETTVILSLSAALRLTHPGGEERLDQYDAALIRNPGGERFVLEPSPTAVAFVIAFETPDGPGISNPS